MTKICWDHRPPAGDRIALKSSWMNPFRLIFLTSIFALTTCLQSKSPADLEVGVQINNISPSPIYVAKGQPLSLNCTASSSSWSVQVYWRSNNEDIPITDPRRVTASNGSLIIKKFNASKKLRNGSRPDEGRYFCVAKSSRATILSRPIDVFPIRPPNLITEPSFISANQGQNVRLFCQVHSKDQTDKVEWLFNSRSLLIHNRLKTFGNVLQIFNISSQDEGNYSCSVLFDSQVLYSHPSLLSVRSEVHDKSLDFVSPSIILVNNTKEPLVLECLTAHFRHLNFRWTRPSDLPLPLGHHIDNFGNLIIPLLSKDVEGDYTCTVQDGSDMKVHATHNIRVSFRNPPTLTRLPQSAIHPSAQTVRLDCAASGVPQPTITWFKDGVALTSSGRYTTKSDMLVISQTTAGDSGVYQCLAENDGGTVISSARLIISTSSDQPKPPTDLKATPVSSTSIVLEWKPSDSPSNLPIVAYTVNYRLADGGVEQRLTSTKTAFIVESLSPFTSYLFYVRAFNNRGAGEPSEMVEAKTLEGRPSAAPHFQTRALSPTNLLITWKPLPLHLANGEVSGYEIHFKRQTQDNYQVEEVPSTTTKFVLEQLIPEATYDIRVLAGTSAGFPNVSDITHWPWTSYQMPSREQLHVITNVTGILQEDSTAAVTGNLTRGPDVEDEEDYEDNNNEVADLHSKQWIMWTFMIIGIVVAILVLSIIVVVVVFQQSHKRSALVHMNGQVPRGVYAETTVEQREMESFLDDGSQVAQSDKNGYSSLSGDKLRSSVGSSVIRT